VTTPRDKLIAGVEKIFTKLDSLATDGVLTNVSQSYDAGTRTVTDTSVNVPVRFLEDSKVDLRAQGVRIALPEQADQINEDLGVMFRGPAVSGPATVATDDLLAVGTDTYKVIRVDPVLDLLYRVGLRRKTG